MFKINRGIGTRLFFLLFLGVFFWLFGSLWAESGASKKKSQCRKGVLPCGAKAIQFKGRCLFLWNSHVTWAVLLFLCFETFILWDDRGKQLFLFFLLVVVVVVVVVIVVLFVHLSEGWFSFKEKGTPPAISKKAVGRWILSLPDRWRYKWLFCSHRGTSKMKEFSNINNPGLIIELLHQAYVYRNLIQMDGVAVLQNLLIQNGRRVDITNSSCHCWFCCRHGS